MNLRTYRLSPLLLLVGTLASEPSSAKCAMELTVKSSQAMTKMIPTFSESGKFLKEEARDLAASQKVLDCDESLGLVKIKLTDGREVWINRTDAIRVAGTSSDSVVCVTQPVANEADRKAPYVSGADPTHSGCKSKTL